jgi:hypothetical protein
MPRRPFYNVFFALAFADLWIDLVAELVGKLDDKNPTNWTHPNGEITKQKIGYRLREFPRFQNTFLHYFQKTV